VAGSGTGQESVAGSGTGQEPVAGSCELGNVPSGCIKGGECQMGGIPTSYLGSPGFKSRSGNRLS
jgi:hypothetical protein